MLTTDALACALPHAHRIVLRYFDFFPAPHSHVLMGDDVTTTASASDLAFAALRALQLESGLRAKWASSVGCSCKGLLNHQVRDFTTRV